MGTELTHAVGQPAVSGFNAQLCHTTDQPQPFPAPSLAAKIGMLSLEPGSLLMEQKMFRGIKQRAEHPASR